jgi:anti-sigma factor RsiW
VSEREQIINFLLQACDAKNKQVEEMQKINAELSKKLSQYEASSAAQVPQVPQPVNHEAFQPVSLVS